MAAFGSHPLGMPLGSGPLNHRTDDLPWRLDPATEEELDPLQEILAPLTVEAPRPTLQFTQRTPGVVVERLSTLYAAKGNLSAHFGDTLKTDIDSRQLDDISACLRQGEEFRRVAVASDLMTLPLTAYYSFLSYAAAAVLAAPDHEVRLRDFAIGHGMRVPQDFEVPLGQLTVHPKGKGRLVQRLIDIYGQQSGLPLRTGAKHAWVRVPSAAPKDLRQLRISLQDLFARILGIEDFYHHTFRKSTPSVKAQIWCSPPYKTRPRLAMIVYGFGPTEIEELYELSPMFRRWKLAREWSTPDRLNFVNLPPTYTGDPTDLEECHEHLIPPEEVMIPLSRGPLGEWRLVSPIEDSFVPQPILIYLVSFLLSSVARYRPDIWSEVVTPGGDDSPGLRAVIEQFYSLALERFPLEALAAILRVDLAVYHHGVEMITS